jgi:hypothetical protein
MAVTTTQNDRENGLPSRTAILVAAARAFGSREPDESVRNPDLLADSLIGPAELALISDHLSIGVADRRSLHFPGFPVEPDGFQKVHAAFFDESRTRGHLWCRVVGNPGPVGMTKGGRRFHPKSDAG